MKAFKAVTGFLLRVSQTRPGAGHVLNAGLFHALRESQLFSVDPDLGVGMFNICFV
jgi:nuclear pore complex protein Nup205